MNAYYNEIDPYCVQWLRNLIDAGYITKGEVDDRPIQSVAADDLRQFGQCHFFAGIGGWSLALQMAGWPVDREVWTASAPCQPFSVASVAHGGAKGQSDERHLWPEVKRLVRERHPATIFGEQVANAIKWGWLDDVFAGLEELGYACGASVLPALAVGARHERKRIFFVADTGCERREGHQPIQCISVATPSSQSIYGDPLAHAGRALDGDLRDVLHCDGLSIVVERSALKGFGNAIVPQVAAEVIGAYMDCRP